MYEDQWLKRFFVVSTVIVSSIIALTIIGATLVHPYFNPTNTPKLLENWGGLIIGFYFGTFITIMKDWMSGKQSSGTEDSVTNNTAGNSDLTQSAQKAKNGK